MDMQKVKRFGEREIRLLFALEQEKNSVFTIAQARKILGTSDASVKNVLKRLKKKNRIMPIQKGIYLFAPLKSGEKGLWTENAYKIVPMIAGSNDYYVGFAAAMNYWGMTEQMPYVIRVAMVKQKKPKSVVQSKFVFVKKRKLGDYQRVSFGIVYVHFSSIEQTILDGLSFPEYCLGIEGVARAIHFTKDKIDWGKLVSMAKRDKSIIQRRLGFLLELLEIKHSEQLEVNFKGFSWLDPAGLKKDFKYSTKWGLKVNVKREDLLEFQRGY